MQMSRVLWRQINDDVAIVLEDVGMKVSLQPNVAGKGMRSLRKPDGTNE